LISRFEKEVYAVGLPQKQVGSLTEIGAKERHDWLRNPAYKDPAHPHVSSKPRISVDFLSARLRKK
jgi:hypothetical protein